MDAVARLKLELQAAKEAYGDIVRSRDNERRNKLDVFKASLDAELFLRYGERMQAALNAADAQQEALNLALEESAASRSKYPLGTKLVEWKLRNLWARQYEKTGRIGVVEVITAASQHSASLKYCRAARGGIVLRLLKKDGTPGLNYDSLFWNSGNWLPEGEEKKG